MTQETTNTGPFGPQRRTNWVRLRTLVILRWVAIVGQLTVITVAQRLYQLDLNILLCLVVIGASAVANLIAMRLYPETARLPEGAAAILLTIDILQLSALLFLTGGMSNPFALLILVPVTISATALNVRTTVALGSAAIIAITVVATWSLPLTTTYGRVLDMPDEFAFGFWVAIVIGVVFLAAYAQRVTAEIHEMSQALTATQMALAREQKLTDLGGVVAAAAHELGTPLATIMLVSSELADELSADPALKEDAILIRDQAERCRDILQSMGRVGKDDLHLRTGPLGAVLREAGEPHADRGRDIEYVLTPLEDGVARQPNIPRKPEIIHGLRNLIQNAVDFSQSQVWVEGSWDEGSVVVRILDDGPGFPQHVLGRIGEPFVRQRRLFGNTPERPAYEGMGLGLFIAKTLLERSGAEVIFGNGRAAISAKAKPGQKAGAVVEVRWPRQRLTGGKDNERLPLGENRPLQA